MTLCRSFHSPPYSLWHLYWLSAVCQFWKVNLLKHGGVRPSYGANTIADCHIRELLTFWYVIFRRLKNVGKSIWSDKAILKIFKPLKKVLCSFCDGVPLKFKKNGRVSSLQLLWWWCPFKIQKEKRAGLQFTSTDYLSSDVPPWPIIICIYVLLISQWSRHSTIAFPADEQK